MTNHSDAGLNTLAECVHASIGEGEGLENFAKALARRVREESEADLGLAVYGPNPPENIEPENSRRGLRGVQLVISDDHKGLKAAATRVLGATSQRCRVGLLKKPWRCD